MVNIKKEVLLITPQMIKPSSKKLIVTGTINPAAIRRHDGKIVLYIRVIERLKKLEDKKYCYAPRMIGKSNEYKLKIDRFSKKEILQNSEFDIIFKDQTKRLVFISHFRKVVLDKTGLRVLSIDKKPTFYGTANDAELGVEDPRITKIDHRYIMTYVSLSRKENISSSIAISEDLNRWEKKGIIFGEQDKDVVIFPEKINGKYVALDRPESNFQFTPPHIWIAYSKDLQSWGNLKSIELLKKEDGDYYSRIGAGCPPIKTKKGWLLIFHTVRKYDKIYVYAGSAALLDLKNPRKIISKSEPIIVPAKSYELKLYENKKIVFPTGIVMDVDERDVLIYSGGGDVVIDVKKISLDSIMDSLKKLK